MPCDDKVQSENVRQARIICYLTLWILCRRDRYWAASCSGLEEEVLGGEEERAKREQAGLRLLLWAGLPLLWAQILLKGRVQVLSQTLFRASNCSILFSNSLSQVRRNNKYSGAPQPNLDPHQQSKAWTGPARNCNMVIPRITSAMAWNPTWSVQAQLTDEYKDVLKSAPVIY